MEKKDKKDKTDAPKKIKASYASSETRSWHEYVRKSRQEEPKRLEDAAKFLAGMISISLTIFLDLNEKAFEGMESSTVTSVIVIAWLLSLLSAFLVLFPTPYRFAKNSAEDIEKMQRKVVKNKQRLLYVSAALFMFALGMLAFIYIQSK